MPCSRSPCSVDYFVNSASSDWVTAKGSSRTQGTSRYRVSFPSRTFPYCVLVSMLRAFSSRPRSAETKFCGEAAQCTLVWLFPCDLLPNGLSYWYYGWSAQTKTSFSFCFQSKGRADEDRIAAGGIRRRRVYQGRAEVWLQCPLRNSSREPTSLIL